MFRGFVLGEPGALAFKFWNIIITGGKERWFKPDGL